MFSQFGRPRARGSTTPDSWVKTNWHSFGVAENYKPTAFRRSTNDPIIWERKDVLAWFTAVMGPSRRGRSLHGCKHAYRYH